MARCSTVFLFFFDFIEGFAVDAQGCGRTRFETLDADLDTARFAIAVIVVVD